MSKNFYTIKVLIYFIQLLKIQTCFYEANEQFRLDKLVDHYILQILNRRIESCFNYNPMEMHKCADVRFSDN